MAARRVTVGRAFVLLLVGVILGAGLFAAYNLSPEALGERVRELLEQHIRADFDFDPDVELSPGESTQVTIRDFVLYYPAKQGRGKVSALKIARTTITIDGRQLMSGEVIPRQVDFYGVELRLTRTLFDDPEFFLRKGTAAPGPAVALPEVVVHGGVRGSGTTILLDFEEWPSTIGRPQLNLTDVAVQPHEDRYEFSAAGTGDRLGRLEIDGAYEPRSHLVRIRKGARISELTWTPAHTAALARILPKTARRPIEVGGLANVTLEEELVVHLDDRMGADLTSGTATAQVRELNGRFGNLFKNRRDGMPLNIVRADADVRLADRRLEATDIEVKFAEGPDEGGVTASFLWDLKRPDSWLDLELHGSEVAATAEQLRAILPPPIGDDVVRMFKPHGRASFDVTVTQRPGLPEKVLADVRVRSGGITFAEFPYEMDECWANVKIETNVATPRGRCDTVRFSLGRGPDVWDAPSFWPDQEVCVRADGQLFFWHTGPTDTVRQDINVRIARLPFNTKLKDALGDGLEGQLYRDFGLGGRAEWVDVRIVTDDWTGTDDSVYRIELAGATAAYSSFPLPLRDVSGTIIQRETPGVDEHGKPRPELEFRNIRANAAGGGVVKAYGALHGDHLDVLVTAKGIGLGAELRETLRKSAKDEPALLAAWDALRPSGTIDAELIYDTDQKNPLSVAVVLTGDARISGYEDLDLPLRGLRGSVAYHAGRVELETITGRIGAAEATLRGHYDAAARRLKLAGSYAGALETPLVERLRRLAGADSPAFDGLEVHAGTAFSFDFELTEDVIRAEISALELRGAVKGQPLRIDGESVIVEPDMVRFRALRMTQPGRDAALEIKTGALDRAKRKVEVDLIAKELDPSGALPVMVWGSALGEALGPGTRVDLDPSFQVLYTLDAKTVLLNGTAEFKRAGASDTGLRPTGVVTFRETLLETDRPRGQPPRLRGRIDVTDLNLGITGIVRDMSGTLDSLVCLFGEDVRVRASIKNGRATVQDFEATDVRMDFSYDYQHLKLSRLLGRFYGGSLKGDIALHTNDPGAYYVELEANNVQLSKLLRRLGETDDDMAGKVSAKLRLHSITGEVADAEGSVWLGVDDGRLVRVVPGLRRAASLLSRVTPFEDKGGRYERAVLEGDIRGDTLHLHKLHLSTSTNDVYLKGTISRFGDLDLEVKPKVTRLLDLPRLVGVPVLSSLLDLWHEIVYEIRFEGTLDNPALRLNPLPWIKRRPPITQSPHAGRVRRMRPRVLP
ncbi:MAG: hypothetical protein ACYTGN_03500 [Planctomycetota bacterium]|jgi:hypothetical protein